MIDFDEEIKKILNEDPLGILKQRVLQKVSIDEKLKASFSEINDFIDDKGHEPKESNDILERKLFSRLKQLRKDFEKASILRKIDKHNLLTNVKEIKNIDDILKDDFLGLLDENSNNIFDLKNIPKTRDKTDFVARRKPCKNFKDYENNLKQVQKEIKQNNRKLIKFRENHLKEGRYYVLDGILLFLEKIGEKNIKNFEGKTGVKVNDPRIRCIFENGLESNMYLRSLGKELNNNGSTVINSNEEDLIEFKKGFNDPTNKIYISDKDKITGHIYILSSLSEKHEIKFIKNLYKIGFCTTSIEDRISNAENETTFLMAGVKIVASYKTFNLNPQKFEKIIHNFFSERCLDIKIADKDGNLKKPKEWYIVPIKVIEQVIELIINKQIQNYKFDQLQNKVVKNEC